MIWLSKLCPILLCYTIDYQTFFMFILKKNTILYSVLSHITIIFKGMLTVMSTTITSTIQIFILLIFVSIIGAMYIYPRKNLFYNLILIVKYSFNVLMLMLKNTLTTVINNFSIKYVLKILFISGTFRFIYYTLNIYNYGFLLMMLMMSLIIIGFIKSINKLAFIIKTISLITILSLFWNALLFYISPYVLSCNISLNFLIDSHLINGFNRYISSLYKNMVYYCVDETNLESNTDVNYWNDIKTITEFGSKDTDKYNEFIRLVRENLDNLKDKVNFFQKEVESGRRPSNWALDSIKTLHRHDHSHDPYCTHVINPNSGNFMVLESDSNYISIAAKFDTYKLEHILFISHEGIINKPFENSIIKQSTWNIRLGIVASLCEAFEAYINDPVNANLKHSFSLHQKGYLAEICEFKIRDINYNDNNVVFSKILYELFKMEVNLITELDLGNKIYKENIAIYEKECSKNPICYAQDNEGWHFKCKYNSAQFDQYVKTLHWNYVIRNSEILKAVSELEENNYKKNTQMTIYKKSLISGSEILKAIEKYENAKSLETTPTRESPTKASSPQITGERSLGTRISIRDLLD